MCNILNLFLTYSMRFLEKYILLVFCSFVYSVSVTFNVDMQEQYLNGGSVYLAGADSLTLSSFGSIDTMQVDPWDPSGVMMQDDDLDGVFSATVELDSNTVYLYKYLNGNQYELAGESDRLFATTLNDTVLNIECFNRIGVSCDDIDNSLVETIFSVDMQQITELDSIVGLLGVNDLFTNFGYMNDSLLTPIAPYDPSALSLIDSNGDGVYSVSIFLEPGVQYQYKFINGNDWGGVEQTDRSIIIPPVSGMYVNEVCFNLSEDCPDFTTSVNQLTFKTNVSNAIIDNGFSLGDTLVVRWGYGETQPFEKEDTLQLMPFSYNYKVDVDSVLISEEDGLYYQYYKILNGQNYREIFFNFQYLGDDVVLAERRYFPLDSLNSYSEIMIEDNLDSNVDPRRMPVFLNTDPIGEEIEVTWTIDMRPAYYQILAGDTLVDIQGTYDVYDVDSLYTWGVWMNGPASSPANGQTWTQWGLTLQGTTAKKMWDDGTHGDAVAGDHIYTLMLNYDADAQVGQECKFGIKGGDNESSYGLNHYENINVADPNIHVYWGSINPLFYNAWDFDLNEPVGDFSCSMMDLNNDGIINVIDIIAVVNIIISGYTPSQDELCAADTNSDGVINVIDIISIVNAIIN